MRKKNGRLKNKIYKVIYLLLIWRSLLFFYNNNILILPSDINISHKKLNFSCHEHRSQRAPQHTRDRMLFVKFSIRWGPGLKRQAFFSMAPSFANKRRQLLSAQGPHYVVCNSSGPTANQASFLKVFPRFLTAHTSFLSLADTYIYIYPCLFRFDYTLFFRAKMAPPAQKDGQRRWE